MVIGWLICSWTISGGNSPSHRFKGSIWDGVLEGFIRSQGPLDLLAKIPMKLSSALQLGLALGSAKIATAQSLIDTLLGDISQFLLNSKWKST